jgi:hypothetical protein
LEIFRLEVKSFHYQPSVTPGADTERCVRMRGGGTVMKLNEDGVKPQVPQRGKWITYFPDAPLQGSKGAVSA